MRLWLAAFIRTACSTDLNCTQSGWGLQCDTDFTNGCVCSKSQDCKNTAAAPNCTPVGAFPLSVCTCDNGACGHGSTCVAGHCAFEAGAACLQSRNCMSGSCVAGVCQ
jgi:hypothetical protein